MEAAEADARGAALRWSRALPLWAACCSGDTGVISGAIRLAASASEPDHRGLVVGVVTLRALGVATLAFVVAKVPETKGRTLEEIGQFWK
jgi:hypothetical protein